MAFAAQKGDKHFVVVDGIEGKQYDVVVTAGGGKIVFDSPDSFHYLALEGDRVYLVEERIKCDKGAIIGDLFQRSHIL